MMPISRQIVSAIPGEEFERLCRQYDAVPARTVTVQLATTREGVPVLEVWHEGGFGEDGCVQIPIAELLYPFDVQASSPDAWHVERGKVDRQRISEALHALANAVLTPHAVGD